MNIDVSYYSAVGGRKNNEDFVSLIEGCNQLVAIVADGLGGYDSGEVASRLATTTINNRLHNMPLSESLLLDSVEKANMSILEQNKENKMKTTVSVVWIEDNIMLLKDGTLKLMDFGAARDVNFEDRRSLSIMLKPGYAPEEQYRSKGIQGPWTDIYALCATIYRCITGVTPDDAMERVFDDCLEKPSKFNADITIDQENVFMKGLSISYKDRYQSVHELVVVLKDVLDGKSKERISNIVINCDDSDEIALHPDDNSDAALFLEETEQDEETVLIEEPEVEDTTVVMLDDIDSTSIESETSMATDEVSHNSTDIEDKVVADIKTTSSQNSVTVCCEYCGAIMQKSQRYCSVCYKTVKAKQDIPHEHQEAPIAIKVTSEDKKKPIDRTSIESMKSCPLCGAVVKRNSGYCFVCGAKINS